MRLMEERRERAELAERAGVAEQTDGAGQADGAGRSGGKGRTVSAAPMARAQVGASAAVLAGLALLGALTVVLPQDAFSQNENRTLATAPALSIPTVLDGSFQEGLEDALSDQFPGRDKLMALGTRLKLAVGRRDIGDAYVGRDGYCFEKVTDADIDEARYARNLARVESLAQAYPEVPFTVMLVPSSGVVLDYLLPAFAEVYDAESLLATARETLASCRLVDPTAALREAADSGVQVFYRTDHHWTSAGAYAAYGALTEGKGAYGPYRAERATDTFLGTLYSRTLDPDATPDPIDLPLLGDAVAATVNGEPARGLDGLYDLSKLEEKDKYQVFFGGNHGIVDITGTGEGTLLVIKDSFANCLVPYLAADYARIVMVDPRYYPGSVRQLLAAGDVDDVLVLYELNNFANDSNQAKLAL